MSSLTVATQMITIYAGAFAVVTGVVGGLLNVLVFVSLKTFRDSSSAYHLAVMSLVNVGTLVTGQLTRILVSGFSIDWSLSSLFYCKFRIYLLQTCALVSLMCLCWAVLDQFFTTSTHPRLQQWSNIKLARLLSTLGILFGILANIPYLIYYTHIVSPSTSRTSCTTTDYVFQQYVNYGSGLLFSRLLPLCIIVVFGLLAWRNVQQLAHRILPMARRELDKQLTTMVLVQAAVTFIAIMPFIIVYFLSLIPALTQDPTTAAHLQFVSSTGSTIYYLYFAVRIIP